MSDYWIDKKGQFSNFYKVHLPLRQTPSRETRARHSPLSARYPIAQGKPQPRLRYWTIVKLSGAASLRSVSAISPVPVTAGWHETKFVILVGRIFPQYRSNQRIRAPDCNWRISGRGSSFNNRVVVCDGKAGRHLRRTKIGMGTHTDTKQKWHGREIGGKSACMILGPDLALTIGANPPSAGGAG